MPDTLVEVPALARRLAAPDWAVVDCRHRLTEPACGESACRGAHVAGAVFAHADRILSSTPVTDRGRHPLPDPGTLCARFGTLGIDSNTQVVAYDDAGGAIAGRLWWMLRHMGHRNAVERVVLRARPSGDDRGRVMERVHFVFGEMTLDAEKTPARFSRPSRFFERG